MKVLKNYPPHLTQGYKSSHTGNDIVGRNPKGYNDLDTIVAMEDGKVTQVINNCNVNTSGSKDYNSPYKDTSNPGNMVVIEHANGYKTRYLHLGYKTVKVKVGQKIKAGQEIGYMGNTGYSFGGHLHLDVLLNDKKIDPYDYVFKGKEFLTLPKPVSRDETTDQIQVIETQLRCRTNHNTSATVIGFCPVGIYNILYHYNDGTYDWYEIESGKWIATEGTWAVVLKAKEEVVEVPQENENKEDSETKQEDNPITPDQPKTDESKESNWIVSLIQIIVDFIKKLFTAK